MPTPNPHLHFLARRNAGARMLPEHLEVLSKILPVAIDASHFVELGESDALFDEYMQLIRAKSYGAEQVWLEADFDEHRFYDQYIIPLFTGKIYWFTKYSEKYGAILIDVQRLKDSILKMIDYDRDSLCLLSTDKSSALLLDKYEEYGEWKLDVITFSWKRLESNP